MASHGSDTCRANLLAQGLSLAIVVSRWHSLVNDRLLEGALECIERLGGSREAIKVVYVPGSFEIPLAVKLLAKSGCYGALIALGTVIRGETAHFEQVAGHAVNGIAKITLDTEVPIGLGILTTDDLDQALARAGSKQGNKGEEAAMAAIEMANLRRQLS